MPTKERFEVTVKATVETNGIETNGIETNGIEMNHTSATDGGDVDFQVTIGIEQSKDVEIEQLNEPEPVPEPPSEVVADQSEDVPYEDEDKAAIEQAYETEQQDYESAETGPEQAETGPEQEEPTQEDDEVDEDDEVVENGEGLPADDGPREIQITLKVDETEEVNAEPAMDETIERATEESPTFEQDKEISLEIKVDDEKIMDVQVKGEEETEEEPESASPKPQDTGDTNDDINLEQEQDEELIDGQKSSQNDSSRDEKVASKNIKVSGWSAKEEVKAKKPGRINTLDFRGNLKKSGRIGTGVVNLESRNASSGAQVDFRAGLKQTGKNPSNIKSPGTTGRFLKSAQDPKGKADFRASLKKSESATAGVKKDLPEKASKLNKPPKEIPPKPAPKVQKKDNGPVEEPPVPTETEVVSENSVATPEVAEKQTKDSKNNNENKFSHKFSSNAQTKASPAAPKKAKEFQIEDK